MFGSVTSKLYQVAIQRKVAGYTNSISESVSDAVADDPQDADGKKRKALSRDQRGHFEVVAKEAGNMFSVAMKARMWTQSSNSDGLLVEARNAPHGARIRLTHHHLLSTCNSARSPCRTTAAQVACAWRPT